MTASQWPPQLGVHEPQLPSGGSVVIVRLNLTSRPIGVSRHDTIAYCVRFSVRLPRLRSLATRQRSIWSGVGGLADSAHPRSVRRGSGFLYSCPGRVPLDCRYTHVSGRWPVCSAPGIPSSSILVQPWKMFRPSPPCVLLAAPVKFFCPGTYPRICTANCR